MWQTGVILISGPKARGRRMTQCEKEERAGKKRLASGSVFRQTGRRCRVLALLFENAVRRIIFLESG